MKASDRAERDGQILELRQQGLSIAKIAAKTGVPHTTVQRAVESLRDTAEPDATVDAIGQAEAPNLAEVEEAPNLPKPVGEAVVTEQDLAKADLPALASMANHYHAEAEQTARKAKELEASAVESAWQAGRALVAAKAQCSHGEWLPWLKDNFKGSHDTAERYRKLASNYACVRNLDSATSINEALRAIAAKPKKQPEASATESSSEDIDKPKPSAKSSDGENKDAESESDHDDTNGDPVMKTWSFSYYDCDGAAQVGIDFVGHESRVVPLGGKRLAAEITPSVAEEMSRELRMMLPRIDELIALFDKHAGKGAK